ncbi:MAG: gamma-glutamylcyclotransferase family protein [Moorellaceae bacterium]
MIANKARIPVFVYGTLMSINSNHMRHLGADGPYPGVLEGYRMYQVDPSFPGIVPAGGGKVLGELYYVSPDALRTLDRYEGVPRLYRREEAEVRLCCGGSVRAWCYVWNGPPGGREIAFSEMPWRDKYGCGR